MRVATLIYVLSHALPPSFWGKQSTRKRRIKMKVVLYGATGNSGQRILQELTKRGHEVTAVARNSSKLPPTVKTVKDDLSNIDAIPSVIRGADVVVSPYSPPQDNPDAIVGVTERQVAAVKKA